MNLPLENEEKLIVVIVLVPVVFTLHYAKAHHRVVYPAERLVVPLVRDRLCKCFLAPCPNFCPELEPLSLSNGGVGTARHQKRRYTVNTVEPVVFRLSRSRCASAASFSG